MKSTRKSRFDRSQFSPRNDVEWAIFTIEVAGGRLVMLNQDGDPAWKGWTSCEAPASSTAIRHHREHGPGSIGLQPYSLGLCHVDVDSGLADARRLAAAHPPLFTFVSRNGRGLHLGYSAPDPTLKERTKIAWGGAVVDFKSAWMCRTSDEALCRIAGALVARADGAEVPELPDSFLDAYDEAGRKVVEELADQAADETSAQVAPESNAAPQRNAVFQSKAAPKRGAPVGRRGTPISEQPAPARRIEDAIPGNRNISLYYRGRWWAGRHAAEFSTYRAFEEHWLPILFEAAMRMDEPEETDARILASIRSALGWAWRNFGGGSVPASALAASGIAVPVPAPDCDPEVQAWSARQRQRSHCGGEATARLRRAQCEESYARIRAIDATTRTVAETAELAGVSESTVYRARRGEKGTQAPLPPPRGGAYAL